MQIALLGMSLKSFLGIMLSRAAWFFVLTQMGYQTLDWLQVINQFATCGEGNHPKTFTLNCLAYIFLFFFFSKNFVTYFVFEKFRHL